MWVCRGPRKRTRPAGPSSRLKNTLMCLCGFFLFPLSPLSPAAASTSFQELSFVAWPLVVLSRRSNDGGIACNTMEDPLYSRVDSI